MRTDTETTSRSPQYSGSHPPHLASADFDADTLPWLDRATREIARYVDGLDPPAPAPDRLKIQLLQWMTQGYLVLERAIEPELIDAYLRDVDELLHDYRDFELRVDCDIHPVMPIKQLEPELVAQLRRDENPVHLRFNDLHNYSIAAKKLSLHPKIARTIEHVFRDRIVVLQSLSFFTGSEQELHADYAFVPAFVPSQLVGSWIALEDIHPDSGPLRYVPGSHVLPKFEWGDGIFRTERSTRTSREFHEYLVAQAERAGLQVQEFHPRKGDVLLWHGALAHGGAPVRDRSRTRKAYVTHYSKASTHFYDFRAPGTPAERIELNGGFLHRSPIDPTHEDVLKHGADL